MPENVSGPLAEQLAATAIHQFPQHRIVAAVLPTEWQAGLASLRLLLADLRPAIALHFGVSTNATGFQLETAARCAAIPIPDNAGHLPESSIFPADGPDLSSSFPAAAIAARLHALAIPACLSTDAGSYLCNAALFTSLEDAATRQTPSLRGFVHIPPILDATTIPIETAVTGGMEILRCCFTQAEYLRLKTS